MASAAQIAAKRMNAQQGAKAATPRSPCGIRPRNSAKPRPNRLGANPARIANWVSRANLSNEISERHVGGKPIRCTQEAKPSAIGDALSHSGSGMNSVSPGTAGKRPAFHSALA
jgi:hypothetical protein